MIEKLIDLLTRIKTLDKPFMIHGVIISDVKAGYIKFFVMTSQEIKFRPETSQFKFNLSSGNIVI
jgi:hypothetical protein